MMVLDQTVREEAMTMKVALFNVSNNLCGECSLALRRFVGGMDGVESIDVEHGKIAVRFDENIVDVDRISKITKDSIEKLGYRIDE
jgi:copper chaperone CopZ